MTYPISSPPMVRLSLFPLFIALKPGGQLNQNRTNVIIKNVLKTVFGAEPGSVQTAKLRFFNIVSDKSKIIETASTQFFINDIIY